MTYSGEKTCGSKTVYYTQKKAREATKEHKHRFGKKMYFYECEYCGYWHLSSRWRKRRVYEVKEAKMKWVG